MGNYRFRLSNMMPKAWFYKPKDMGGTRKHGGNKTLQHPTSPASITTTKTQTSKTKQSNHSYPRKSYYFSRELVPSDRFYGSADSHFLEPPGKSSKKQSRKRNMIRTSPRIVNSSVSAGCSCRDTLWAKADSPPEYSVSSTWPSSSSSDSSSDQKLCERFPQEFRSDCILTTESWSGSCTCNFHANAVDNKPFVKKFDKLDDFYKCSGLELPPIITKPAKFNDKLEVTNAHGLLPVKEERITMKKGQKKASPVRKVSMNSPGVRLRINSPKIASRKIQGHYSRKSISSSSTSSSRKSLSDSFAVVKSSFDPQRDFRDSMVEMIMENNIRASKDLEDLLACYLSLNSDEYHDLIIHVFKQIWFELGDVRLK